MHPRHAVPFVLVLLLAGVARGEDPPGPAARLRQAVTVARASGRLHQLAGEQHLLSERTAIRLHLSVDEAQVLLEVETVDLEHRADLIYRSTLCLDGVGAITSLSASMKGALNASVSARWRQGDGVHWQEPGPAGKTGELRCREDVYLPRAAMWLWALFGDEQELVCRELSLSPLGSDPQGAYYIDPHLSCFGETTASNRTGPDGRRTANGFGRALELDPSGRILRLKSAPLPLPDQTEELFLLPFPEQPEEVFHAATAERYREALEAARR